ncbi:MAG: hypothetical protein R3F15_12770 [Lysobacterales bacterium]
MFRPLAAAVFLALGSQAAFAQGVSLDADAAAAVVRLRTPAGAVVDVPFANAQQASLAAALATQRSLADGSYRWQIVRRAEVPQYLLARAQREQVGSELPTGWPGATAVESGSFTVARGQMVDSRAPEVSAAGKGHNGSQAKDAVFGDDVIINGGTGSLCVGTDCVNNQNFGSDTIRMSENNLRITFFDTSNSASFPSNDWELTANDTTNGGANYFAITDRGTNRRNLVVEAGALNNNLFVGNGGFVGVGTNIPQRSLHAFQGDSPGLRLEQSPALGFPAQTWDVVGNETGLVVRDQTTGTQPFRIRPGAPTDATVISAAGFVGLGTTTPGAALDISSASAPFLLSADAGGPSVMQLDPAGNLTITGTLTQGSSRSFKEQLVAVTGASILDLLANLPIYSWQYIGSSERHLGPVAEDFHAAFGLGTDPTRLAPGDLAGVAVAATQALQAELAAKDAKIAELEARLARIEARLAE